MNKVIIVLKGITPQGRLTKGNIFEWSEKECEKYNKRYHKRKNLQDEYEKRKEQQLERDSNE